ncbi:CDP-diacylglycerol--glycerol-3-phosphate 3-phosphatidyltransferase [Lachnoclostridium sp. MSJ-17]|uniref:CDP-diacylglycerol--glycerol-3-phosphate 3-phosphatidyltransferase n=1 Tax=Lachnoclostridium sp. MSJ-17 TaxID=2841516 RepID=UPI001C125004|nr:CDP-diacylglycerol--glycerol-3-phosphate 3-phosphatidyltransferase [Lachnoclostridium sp. MSJ-17]MBU5462295.1 CDP-diacylglycerol--glycerol-3-phosphate 3-phosphatidyltransferase [Lachnoclostridium sp. MSJ-17]
MNFPNKLTVGRIILVPLFVAALLIPFPLHNIAALLIFIAASITDLLDGKIARKHNLITDFGKFADPLADKILVLSALLCFIQLGWCDCVAVIIVLFREFTVTSIRLIAAAKGEVIAANIWGKVKTVTQMVAIIAILVFRAAYEVIFMLLPADITGNADFCATANQWLFWGGEALVWISTVFAIISGVIYLVQNRHFISEK